MNLKPIPFSPNFFVSRDGKVFDKDLNERKQYKNADGYATASVLLSDNTWRTFGVHRLVALTYLPIDNPDEMVINHRDLNRENNSVENLEWVTVSENNIHAALFRKNPKKPIGYVEKEGEYSFISNIDEGCEVLNCSKLDVWDAVRLGSRVNGFKFKVFTNGTLVPKKLLKTMVGKAPILRPLKSLDLTTDEILYFPSVQEAARHFETDPGHVSMSIYEGFKVTLFKKNFILANAILDFPVIDKDLLAERQGSIGFDVIVFNIASQTYSVYESASKFIKENGLSKKAVSTRLKRGKLGPVGGFYFSYYKSPNKEHLFEVVGRPGP